MRWSWRRGAPLQRPPGSRPSTPPQPMLRRVHPMPEMRWKTATRIAPAMAGRIIRWDTNAEALLPVLKPIFSLADRSLEVGLPPPKFSCNLTKNPQRCFKKSGLGTEDAMPRGCIWAKLQFLAVCSHIGSGDGLLWSLFHQSKQTISKGLGSGGFNVAHCLQG